MITQTKGQYVSPECEELEMNLEGIVCLSPGAYPKWEEDDI